jgi:AcrR family transcriptional regulator
VGRKAGITREDVTDAAQAIADAHGLGALTLAAVAERLAIKPPSLYNHVDGLDGLRRELALRGMRRTAELVINRPPELVGQDALRQLGRDYRRFALEHPGLYASTVTTSELIDDEEIWVELSRTIDALQALLLAAGIPDDKTVAAIRAVRAMLHGFVTLERTGGFGLPESSEVSFDIALDVLLAGLRDLGDPEP